MNVAIVFLNQSLCGEKLLLRDGFETPRLTSVIWRGVRKQERRVGEEYYITRNGPKMKQRILDEQASKDKKPSFECLALSNLHLRNGVFKDLTIV